MRFKPAYQILTTLSLLLVFLMPMVVKDIHVMIEHHEVEKVCEAPDSGQHLHSQHSQHRPCVLCHFNFSEYLESDPLTGNRALLLPSVQLPSSYLLPAPDRLGKAIQQRGPPLQA